MLVAASRSRADKMIFLIVFRFLRVMLFKKQLLPYLFLCFTYQGCMMKLYISREKSDSRSTARKVDS